MRKIIIIVAAAMLIIWEFSKSEAISGHLNMSQISENHSMGYQIQVARKSKGMSIKELSKLSGLSSKHLKTIENNKATPTRDFIIKLQEILEIEILLDGDFTK